ncbi:MAG: hypothetical protein J5833_04560 [Victivallales bacterium]|nr:hypothetical protein [Victivallales bacterium]
MPNKLPILLLLALGMMMPLALFGAEKSVEKAEVLSGSEKSVEKEALSGEERSVEVLPALPSARRRHQAMSGKQTWQQSFEMNLPISTAKIQVRSKFEAKGYILKHETPIGKRQEACVMLWEKDDSKVIVMLKKNDIDRTWFSQGEFKDAK